MKRVKLIYQIITVLALSLLAVGCVKRADDLSLVESVKITVAYPQSDFINTPYVGKEVELVGKYKYKATTNENGEAVFENVMPGVYTFSISQKVLREEYDNLVNPPLENKELVVNGVVSNIVVYEPQERQLELQLGVMQNVLISKIYYATAKDTNNKNYIVDQYIELYNNADEPVEIKNLYLGLVETESTPFFYESRYEFLAAKDVYSIPDQTVQPGQSIVLARQAINHKEFAPLSVDLTTADYENKPTSTAAIHNPNVPELPIAYASLSGIQYINLLYNGGNQLILFNYDGVVADIEKIRKPNPASGSAYYLKIPSNMVIDGVECLKYDSQSIDLSKKRLAEAIDATYVTLTTTAARNNEGIERKVAKFVDGRAVLVDTNNSLNDFTTTSDPTPRVYTKPELQPQPQPQQ